MRQARPSCRMLLAHETARADSRAWEKTGNRIAARMAIMAITTRSSIRVKALGAGRWVLGVEDWDKLAWREGFERRIGHPSTRGESHRMVTIGPPETTE